MRLEVSNSASRVIVPMCNVPSASCTYSRPGTRLISTSTDGLARRNRMRGMRLWPPPEFWHPRRVDLIGQQLPRCCALPDNRRNQESKCHLHTSHHSRNREKEKRII